MTVIYRGVASCLLRLRARFRLSEGMEEDEDGMTLEDGKYRIGELLSVVATSHGVEIQQSDIKWIDSTASDQRHLLVVDRQDEIWTDAWAEFETRHLTSLETNEEVWGEVLEILREEIIDVLRHA